MDRIKPFLPYLIASGIGLVLSLLSGAFGGVGFGTILWKAVLSAALWGSGAWGLHLLLKAMLPDVAKALEGEPEPSAPSGDGDGGSSTGQHLNLSTHDESTEDAGGEPPLPRPGPMRDPLEGMSSVTAPSMKTPSAAPKAPRPGDPNASFPQEEKILAKAVRSVMNQ